MTSEAAKRKGIPASVVVREVMALVSEGVDDGAKSKSDAQSEADVKSAILQKFSPNTIKAILELLCDESVRLTTFTMRD